MTINRATRLVVTAELPLILAISPLLLFPTPKRLLVLIVVPFIWFCARIATGRFVPNTPVSTSLSLLLAMAGLSLWTTFDISFSLGKVAGVILGVLIFWAIVRRITTQAQLMVGALAFVLAGSALAVVGLLGTQWNEKFPVFTPIIAMLPAVIRGIPGAEEGFNPNAVAGSLVLFVPLQVALATIGSERSFATKSHAGWVRATFVTGQLALLFLTASTILLLQSRGAWFGLVAVVLAFLVLYRGWTRLLAVAGIGAVATALGREGFSRLVSAGAGSGVDGMAGRFELWSRALYGIQDFGLTGMGMNAFRKVMPLLYPAFQISPTTDAAHAHNQLLQVALDLGLPGLVAYASIWLLAGSLLVSVYLRANEASSRAIAGGLGAGLIGYFVFGLTDAIPLGAKVGVFFWVALGLSIALHNVAFIKIWGQEDS